MDSYSCEVGDDEMDAPMSWCIVDIGAISVMFAMAVV